MASKVLENCLQHRKANCVLTSENTIKVDEFTQKTIMKKVAKVINKSNSSYTAIHFLLNGVKYKNYNICEAVHVLHF
jgi:hypothetical protein